MFDVTMSERVPVVALQSLQPQQAETTRQSSDALQPSVLVSPQQRASSLVSSSPAISPISCVSIPSTEAAVIAISPPPNFTSPANSQDHDSPPSSPCPSSETSNTNFLNKVKEMFTLSDSTIKLLCWIVAFLSLVATALVIFPTFKGQEAAELALQLAKWTASKDFLEHCEARLAASGNSSLSSDCLRALAHGLSAPPHFNGSLMRRAFITAYGQYVTAYIDERLWIQYAHAWLSQLILRMVYMYQRRRTEPAEIFYFNACVVSTFTIFTDLSLHPFLFLMLYYYLMTYNDVFISNVLRALGLANRFYILALELVHPSNARIRRQPQRSTAPHAPPTPARSGATAPPQREPPNRPGSTGTRTADPEPAQGLRSQQGYEGEVAGEW